MKLGFVPDRRNLGGKQNIDQLQRNHLLALINARSVTSNMQAPKQHVDYAKRQNRTMPHAKNIGQITQEFREVYEAKRRVIELKKGGIDQTRPICFDRRNYIRNRTCIAKDIQTQDHLRNLNSLNKKLTHIDEQHSKNKQRILQSQQSSSQHLHQQSQSTVNHDHSHFFSPKSLTRPSSAYSKNANNNQSKYSIDYLSAGITPTMSAQDILQNSYGYQQQGQAQNVRRKPPQSAKPAASREKLAIIPNNNFFSMDYSEMMAYDRSVIGAEGDAQQQQAARNDQFGGYQEELVEVDDDNEDYDEVGQIDQQYYQYDQNRNSNHAGEQSYEENQEFYHPNTNPNKPYHSSYYDDRLNNNQSHTISSNYMMDAQQQQQQQQQQNLRVINSMTNLQPPKKTKQEIMEMIPKIPKSFAQHSQADPYTELRRQLLAVIMDCRLYDKKEIMGLAGMVKKKNSHLELNEIIVVCRHIVLRLYGDV